MRLNGWKSRCLSLAGRVTLAKSALASMPSYVMQTVELPNSVCSRIDRICRNFIWGSNESNRKVHLINWNKICSPKGDARILKSKGG